MQGPNAPVERNFTVLQEDEVPRPGTLFGIDAEFVALSQPDKVLQGCVTRGCGPDVSARALQAAQVVTALGRPGTNRWLCK
jgi:hypothetical protein